MYFPKIGKCKQEYPFNTTKIVSMRKKKRSVAFITKATDHFTI